MGPSLIRFTVPGDPVPHERPRLGRRGHVFTPPRTAAYRTTSALLVRAASTGRSRALVGLRVTFYRATARRCDLDNLLKSLLDGITESGRIWEDDSQVRELHAHLILKAAHPRAEVEVYRLV